MLSRREVIKMLSMVPAGGLLAGNLNGKGLTPAALYGETPGPSGPLNAEDNIFRSIGVEPIINCRGTFTIIGGSIEHPHVKATMSASSNDFIQYDELAFGIGRRLAQLTGAEWGMVSAGCAAALKHLTAACVTDGNPEKLIRIPDLTGFEKTEVIMPRHSRTTYDHGVRNIGVKIITVDSVEELESAMSSSTAMIWLMSGRTGPLGLENVVKLAKPKGIPVLVDAAAEDLTIPNVHLEMGADVVAYSGGKALWGPQCSGLILGDKNIIMSAWQASSPHHGPGRDNKVGREEMMGLLAAVEAWVERDHDAVWNTWLGYLDTISKRVSVIDGVTAEIDEPTGLGNRSPRLNIIWDPEKLHITGEEIAEEVGRNKPRIALGSRTRDGLTSINITSGQMQPGNDEVVADRLFDILSQKREPKSKEMRRPGADISGRWKVDVEFFSGKSEHTLFIEQQDGNWIQGSHKGDFSLRDMAGTIEGNEVKFISTDRHVADRITFIFTGVLDEDTISGEIFMGEYLTAKFTAAKHDYPAEQNEISVPGGPPLAT